MALMNDSNSSSVCHGRDKIAQRNAYASAYECVLSRSCSIDNSSYDSAVKSFATGFDEFGETVMEEYAIEGDA